MPTTEKSASNTPGTTNSDMGIDDNVAVASFHAGARDEKRTVGPKTIFRSESI